MSCLPQGSLIGYMSSKVKEGGGINLAQGIPGYEPPAELLESLRKASFKNVHQYPPGTGNFRLADFIAHSFENELQITRDDVLITNGATEALSLLFLYFTQFFKQEFSVLSFDPAYESYSRLPEHFGVKYVSFSDYSQNSIDFESLVTMVKKNNVKLLFLSSPGNPYGRMFSEKELDTLCLMSEELDFYIIFDAVYQELYTQSKPYQGLKNFGKRYIYVNSFSKLLSITGWRIGYLIADSTHMKGIRSMHDYTGLCVPSVLQEALIDYLEENNGGIDYIAWLRNQVNAAFSLFIPELKKMDFVIPSIEGGYFIWAQLPSKFKCGFDFAEKLYEKEKIAVVPGIHFSKNATSYIRINIARPEHELKLAIEGLKSFVLN
ncbi:MAG: pyridoxal phosphate-dependent aminotransferase [Bacteroidales bacterium]|nr:pyridoxal phosphate-dependent aminotransferase [Bacteroidales bacterium]